jgi:ribosomal protein S18 acetylase RimI-like enzyme
MTVPSRTPGGADDFERTIGYWRQLQELVSTDRVAFPWGTAYLDASFPVRYDANHLWIEDPVPDVTADQLIAEADRILGGAGLGHRKIMVAREDDGRRLAIGFAERGYRVSPLLTMAVTADAEGPVDVSAVEVVDFATARPALETVTLREPHGTSAEVVRQLTDYHGKILEVLDGRVYVVRDAGRIAAFCELYLLDGVAQVEDVNTLEEFRGRGYAKAVVSAAVRDARAADAELIFLYADADDWPQHLYRRLGFRDLGTSYEYLSDDPAHAPRG